jgi:hypothetical protein
MSMIFGRDGEPTSNLIKSNIGENIEEIFSLTYPNLTKSLTYQEQIRSSQYVNDFGRDGEPTSNLIKSKIGENIVEISFLTYLSLNSHLSLPRLNPKPNSNAMPS